MLGQNKHALRYVFAALVSSWFAFLLMTPKFAWGTTLSDLAAVMQPGEWRSFTPGNLNTINDASNWAAYADSATWDPISRKFLFLGSYHATPYRFPTWSDATNSWANGPALPGLPYTVTFVGHGYDHNAIDAGNGNFYYFIGRDLQNVIRQQGFTPHDLYRFNIAAGTWTTLPDNNLKSGGYCCDSIAYFPEMGGIIWLDSNNDVYLFRESTQQWSKLTTLAMTGNLWTFAEYNPVYHVVLLGRAGGSLFKLNSTGQATQLNNVPSNVTIYDGNANTGHVTVDPVTGEYLVLTPGNLQMFRYNVSTDTWQAMSQPPSGIQNSGIVGTPVSTYGVIIYASCGPSSGSCDGTLWVYKHSTSTVSSSPSPASDTSAPSAPSSLLASSLSDSQTNLAWTASTDNVGVTGYKVERCSGSTCTNFVQIGTPTGTSYSDTGLSANTTYRYRVRATDAAG